MFRHCFKYNLRRLLRDKTLIFWLMIFPILLGTFFYIAFSGLYSDELFEAVPVAVVVENKDEALENLLVSLSEGDEALLKLTQSENSESALALMKDEKVEAVIYVGDNLRFSTAAGSTIGKSIVKSILDQYKTTSGIIGDVASVNPEKIKAVAAVASEEISPIEEKNFSSGNMDAYVQFFFNLIAMACLMSSTAGITAATENQGNLSSIGARRCISPVNKQTEIVATLLATTLLQVISLLVASVYFYYILGVDFGTSFPMVLIIDVVGVFFGVAMGFFIGACGKGSESLKNAICLTITMGGSVLSGLMIAEIRIWLENHLPVVNRINPLTLISDAFYSLSIYDTYDRFARNLLTLAAFTVLLYVGGFLMTRRKKYASI